MKTVVYIALAVSWIGMIALFWPRRRFPKDTDGHHKFFRNV